MSNSACCDLTENCTLLNLRDMCHNPKCNRQKQITFTPKQIQLEGAGCKTTMRKVFRGSQTASDRFLKSAVKVAAPFISMAVGAKTKIPKVAQATPNTLKCISGGKIL